MADNNNKVKEQNLKEQNLKNLELTINKLDKVYGKGTVMKLGDSTVVPLESISTGSLGLDIALGIGGLPKGRVPWQFTL